MDLQRLTARSQIIKLIRRFFDERGYVEMHTPRLVGLPGQEPHLEPFWTTVRSEQCAVNSAALITSPEYMMKRLLAVGFDKIYDLGPCFRNGEPWDGTHDPEFLLLEWYRRNADLQSLMDECEKMIHVVGTQFIASNGVIHHVPTIFRRMTVEEAWREYAGIELAPLLEDRSAMAHACLEHGQTVAESDTWDDLYFKIFLSEIEPWLSTPDKRRPSFLYRYPASMAALARRSEDNPLWADRVELYMGGLELANGFAELADSDEQRRRFLEEQEQRRKMGKKTWSLDEQFLAALPKMGNAVGIAFGVDRFVMLLTGATSINDVIPSSARERFTLAAPPFLQS